MSQAVGSDAAKLIKRHLTVDPFCLGLRVLVTAASLPERQRATQVLSQVQQLGNAVSRLHTIWAVFWGEDSPENNSSGWWL